MTSMASTARAAAPPEDTSLAAPGALALRRLAQLLAVHAPHDGGFPLRMPGTCAIRFSRMSSEPMYATVGPSVCIVAQGAKAIMLGSDVFEYDAARKIRSQPGGNHTVLIALTGWGQNEDRRKTEAAGFDRHIVKPVTLSQLETILADLNPTAPTAI